MTAKPFVDTPYKGRSGGRYVRASPDEEPRRVDDTDTATPRPETTKPETTKPETGTTETAGKPARKRN